MHFCLTNWKNNYWEFVGKATHMGVVLKKNQQNKDKYDDKKKINVTCAPPSSWPWYEYCDYFFIGITKINGVPKVLIKEWYALLIKRPRLWIFLMKMIFFWTQKILKFALRCKLDLTFEDGVLFPTFGSNTPKTWHANCFVQSQLNNKLKTKPWTNHAMINSLHNNSKICACNIKRTSRFEKSLISKSGIHC